MAGVEELRATLALAGAQGPLLQNDDTKWIPYHNPLAGTTLLNQSTPQDRLR